MSKIRSYSEMFSIIRSVHDRFFLFTRSNLLEIMIWKAKKKYAGVVFSSPRFSHLKFNSWVRNRWGVGLVRPWHVFRNVLNKAREWRHDSDKTQANKLEWWMILKISLRAKVGVPKPLVKRESWVESFAEKSVICILFLDFARFAILFQKSDS